jgi:hypothetical protein
MFEVWQNLAPFGGRLIGGAIEALLTKIVNQQLSVLPIVVFFVAAVSIITQPNDAESIISPLLSFVVFSSLVRPYPGSLALAALVALDLVALALAALAPCRPCLCPHLPLPTSALTVAVAIDKDCRHC